MKVELTPTITNQKTNIFTKVKRFFLGKTKPLQNDTFEKATEQEYSRRKIISRSHPNWCDAPEDGYRNNTIADRICYYPEDLKKMETMTEEERYKYQDYLDSIGRYYYDDSYHVDTPALDKVTKEYGIDIKDFIIKDDK